MQVAICSETHLDAALIPAQDRPFITAGKRRTVKSSKYKWHTLVFRINVRIKILYEVFFLLITISVQTDSKLWCNLPTSGSGIPRIRPLQSNPPPSPSWETQNEDGHQSIIPPHLTVRPLLPIDHQVWGWRRPVSTHYVSRWSQSQTIVDFDVLNGTVGGNKIHVWLRRPWAGADTSCWSNQIGQLSKD